jgi:hypothetical protein
MEYGLIAIVLFGLIKLMKNEFRIHFSIFKHPVCILFCLSLLSVLVSFFEKNPLFQIFSGYRMYVLPLLLFSSLDYMGFYNRVNSAILANVLVLFSIISIISTFFQFYTFNGELSSLWFYDYFATVLDIKLEDVWFNYLRDDKLRATGLYVNTLINSMVIGFFSLFNFARVLYSDCLKVRMVSIIILCGLMYALYLTNARIGFVMFFVGTICGLLFFKTRTKNFGLLLSIPLFCIAMTFIALLLGFIRDLSALGRLIQYVEFLSFLKIQGIGIGNDLVITQYDSWYISVLLAFGIFSVFYIGLHYFLVRRLNFDHSNFVKIENNLSKSDLAFYFTIYAFSFSLVYIFAFQFTIGGPALMVFYMLNNMTYSKIKHIVL